MAMPRRGKRWPREDMRALRCGDALAVRWAGSRRAFAMLATPLPRRDQALRVFISRSSKLPRSRNPSISMDMLWPRLCHGWPRSRKMLLPRHPLGAVLTCDGGTALGAFRNVRPAFATLLRAAVRCANAGHAIGRCFFCVALRHALGICYCRALDTLGPCVCSACATVSDYCSQRSGHVLARRRRRPAHGVRSEEPELEGGPDVALR